jgi:hypothetical protein
MITVNNIIDIRNKKNIVIDGRIIERFNNFKSEIKTNPIDKNNYIKYNRLLTDILNKLQNNNNNNDN